MNKNTFYFEKTVLYGAGHPQIPYTKFAITGTYGEIKKFFESHETTHARFTRIDGRKLTAKQKENIKSTANYDCSLD